MGEAEKLITSVLASIIGIAILAVLVSSQSATSSVIQAFASGFSSILGVAVSPIAASNAGSAIYNAGTSATSTTGAITNTLNTVNSSGILKAAGGLLGSASGGGSGGSSNPFAGAGGNLPIGPDPFTGAGANLPTTDPFAGAGGNLSL